MFSQLLQSIIMFHTLFLVVHFVLKMEWRWVSSSTFETHWTLQFTGSPSIPYDKLLFHLFINTAFLFSMVGITLFYYMYWTPSEAFIGSMSHLVAPETFSQHRPCIWIIACSTSIHQRLCSVSATLSFLYAIVMCRGRVFGLLLVGWPCFWCMDKCLRGGPSQLRLAFIAKLTASNRDHTVRSKTLSWMVTRKPPTYLAICCPSVFERLLRAFSQ